VVKVRGTFAPRERRTGYIPSGAAWRISRGKIPRAKGCFTVVGWGDYELIKEHQGGVFLGSEAGYVPY